MGDTKVADVSTQSEEDLVSNLPREKGWAGPYLFQYQGFWYPSRVIRNVIYFQRHFQAHDTDIILASKPKSGTTWLKALVFTIVNRSYHTMSDTPLLTSSPHELVPFLEFTVYAKTRAPNLGAIPSPRLFSTHVPYSGLPESIKHSDCKIVYICRNPLDILVSFWHFSKHGRQDGTTERPLEDWVEAFCEGVEGFGPFWDHMLEYWKESLERPDKVLFMKYEELKEDPILHIKRLAKFIGYPFSSEEDRQGVIEDIEQICSLKNLKGLEVNKTEKFMPNFENKCYFRKGEVGDWINYLSPSMVKKLDEVKKEKFAGSGLMFRVSNQDFM